MAMLQSVPDPRPMLSWRDGIILPLLVLVSAVALAEAYSVLGRWLNLTDARAWLVAAWVHSGLALWVLWHLKRQDRLRLTFALFPKSQPGRNWLEARPWLAYAPALIILAGSAILVACSRSWGGAVKEEVLAVQWAWILWIPIVEELVFRVGFGQTLRARFGFIWGAWFSSLLFALVHASPTVANILALKVGLPLGPFLLGLACEMLYGMTGRVIPAMLLHAACNATVVIFARGDMRWLRWLNILYQD